MAFEEILSVQPLSSAPNTQVTTDSTTSASKAHNMMGVEKKVSRSETLSDEKGAAWLELNSSTVFEPVGVVPPPATQSVADRSDISTSNQTFLPQLEIVPKPAADQTSQILPAIENNNMSQDAAPDGSSEKASLTEIFTNDVTASTKLGTMNAGHAESKPELPLRIIAPSEVAKHNTVQDSWLIIRGEVFDVTKFQHEHPGGAKIISGVLGKDATKKFDKYHRRALLDTYRTQLRIGKLDETKTAERPREKGFLRRLGLGRKQG